MHKSILAAGRLAAGILLALSFLIPSAARAQTDEVPTVTRTYALENARVVQAPGRTLERATVVVRDGLIVAVGPDAPVPFDAERIAADSLVVYAGFIDGLSHAGIPQPKDDDSSGERPDNPGHPPNDVAGIQPDRDARTLLDAEDSSIEKLREAGFTVAHVVPHGQMLPGRGAIILLAGDDPNALVLKGDASLFAQLKGARGVYPATTMAVLAKWRQLYREAQRRQKLETLYAANPAGLERPSYDPVHYAFFPVLSGEMPVFFYTEGALDVHRALDLERDLGFPLVLAGLAQSFETIDALKQADAPLLLTLDLPEDKKDEKDEKAASDSTSAPDTTVTGQRVPPADSVHTMTPDVPGTFFNSDQRTRSYEDVSAEKENLLARQEVAREKFYRTAAMLNEAGLSFGFATMDVKPSDIHEHLRKMIAYGLPEEVALAALTTHAADVLGIASSVGTVERGKIANLVVTSGPVFDEESTIRYVFVDGRKFEMEAKAKKATDSDASVDPVGAWSYEVETPNGTASGTITLTGTRENLSGTISNSMMPGDPAELEEIDLDGSVLSFEFDSGQFGRIAAVVTISGDDLEGTLDVPDAGSIPISGTRTSGPNR